MGKALEKTLSTTALGKWYQNSFAKSLASAIGTFLKGALTIALSTVANDLMSSLTGSSVAGTLTGVGVGAVGGAMAGSIAGPIGTAIGAVAGGIIGAVDSVNDTVKRIEDKVSEINKAIKSEYDKLVEQYLAKITPEVQEIVNTRRKELGMSEIDWNSSAGAYAKSQIEEYLKNTPASQWNASDMMKIANTAYDYQAMRAILDAYTETDEFRALTGGGTFDLNNTKLRNEFAKAIIASKMLGPNYDYNTSDYEQVVKDYGGTSMTNDQVKAFIEKYAELSTENKTAEERFADGIDQWTGSLNTINAALGELPAPLEMVANGLNGLSNALATFKQDLGKIEITLDDSGVKATYKPNLNGDSELTDQYVELTGLAAWLAQGGISGSIWRALTGGHMSGTVRVKKFNGGMIKPVYKAHGGAIGVDTVPVMAQPGEYIVRSAVVNKVGMSAMNALNQGDTKLAAALMGRPRGNIAGSYNRNLNTTNSDNRRSIRNYVRIVNKNTASRLNSGYALANRLALGL